MYIILLLTLFTFCDTKLCSRVSQMMILDKCFFHLTFFRQLTLIFNILVDPSWCNTRNKKESIFIFKYFSNYQPVYLGSKFLSTMKETAIAESYSFQKVIVALLTLVTTSRSWMMVYPKLKGRCKHLKILLCCEVQKTRVFFKKTPLEVASK